MKLILPCLLSMLCFCAAAQNKGNDQKPDYPQDYFRNPLDIPIFLAGNFGECRPGHFHSGVDIKTLGKENQPVHAAADGYISRIKMESGGFGHGIYITHPNGYTTLYAHLNKFAPAIQQYVSGQQYEQKKWNVDLQLSPGQFPVTKGQQIAWSGNTGASTAPHLHFEIRDTKTEHPLNPELFGLPIVDKIPPVPTEVVFYYGKIYDRSSLTATLKKEGDTYQAVKTDNIDFKAENDTVEVCAEVTGIGINVNDYMDGSDNTIAFYTARLFMDDSLQAEITLDNIGYDETRYINAYTDYEAEKSDKKWIQNLFQLPGNYLDGIYTYLNSNKGRLDFTEAKERFDYTDRKVHKVTIVLTDDRNNTSTISFFVHPKGIAFYPPKNDCKLFSVNEANTFSNANVSFSLDEKQLYDDVCFDFKSTPDPGAFSDKYQLHHAYVPVHHYFDLKINPNKAIPSRLTNKVVMMYSDDKDVDGRAASPAENGWYKARVRNFGTYWLDIDTIPPVITSQQRNNSNLGKAKEIMFEVKDSMASVKNFSGYLDGKWVCFEQHSNRYFYEFDGHCPRGKHELIFKAEDENGNEAVYKLTFVR